MNQTPPNPERAPPGRLRAAIGSLAFLALAPGTVAGLIPWLLTRWHTGDPPLVAVIVGALLIGCGAPVLLWSFGRFVLEGVGTPAPVAPTQTLVIGGIYRHVRNPMYLAVVATIAGQALILWRPVLAAYTAIALLVMAAFSRFYEEPRLRRRYGAAYDHYRTEVPGWLPRIRRRRVNDRSATTTQPRQ